MDNIEFYDKDGKKTIVLKDDKIEDKDGNILDEEKKEDETKSKGKPATRTTEEDPD